MNLTNIIDKNMNIYNDKSMVLSRFIIEFVFTEEVYLFYVSDVYIFFVTFGHHELNSSEWSNNMEGGSPFTREKHIEN
jgi:hypothetical protein